MPYYIGDVIQGKEKLVARTPERFREGGIEVLIQTPVTRIDTEAAAVGLANGETVGYDILAIGTGTLPIMPGIPGQDLEGVFVVKSLNDAIRIKAWIEERQVRKAAIIGAGFIGMEMAENLRHRHIETTIINRGSLPVTRWDPVFCERAQGVLDRNGVVTLKETDTRNIERGSDDRLHLDTTAGELTVDLLILAIGVKPDVRLAAAAGIPLGKSGAIQVDFSQRTPLENVYAAGDCCEVFNRVSKRWVHIPLGDIANKQGRVAGRNIGGTPILFPGVVAAQSFRLFDLEMAATGIDEREATLAGYHPASIIIWGNALAGSMPGNSSVGIKLIADRSTGRLLGAQAIGGHGAVSRINTLSCALWAGLGLDEVAYLDLAYAPPFSPSWDPIHVAAQNLLKKL
ncbi:MAG: FAD-dependent oxidoreductase [Syntrophales bacterium]|jgi:NADPH-dependent 2,4-dienoyl-CoA reductase/sulfur reductase-like enzyme|nr:FAD-dependent oxidoreductase [Syntrophales bacterium]